MLHLLANVADALPAIQTILGVVYLLRRKKAVVFVPPPGRVAPIRLGTQVSVERGA